MTATLRALASLAPLLAAACDREAARLPFELQAHSFARSEWSEPVNLGAPVNSVSNDMNAALSPDELSIYFASTRPGGQGGADIWVSRRASFDSPWETPVNLGRA